MRDIPFKTTNPCTEEKEIKALEERYHFRMPDDMKQFYLKHNGGCLPSGAKIHTEDCALCFFHPIGCQYQEHILTINQLLEWQQMDKFIPMYFIPFCSDAADDSYYIRVDAEGYGKVYYIFSELLDDFLENPEENGFIADSFTEFLGIIKFF